MIFGSLTLRWRIVIFYFMFGFLPLLIMSYTSFYIASETMKEMTGRQVTQLMERISQQTTASFRKASDDIFQFSQNPVIQLSFLQFTYGQRMETVKEKLTVYRANSEMLDAVALYTEDGTQILSSPANYTGFSRDEMLEAFKSNFSTKQLLTKDGGSITLYKRVYDYEDDTAAVGLLVFKMSTHAFTDFIEQVDIIEGMQKQVLTNDGRLVYENISEDQEKSYGDFREYTTYVKDLGWKITLRMPERTLLKDIIKLRNTSQIFALFMGSLAFIASLFFVKRILTPVRQIIKGTKRFADGDLDYRINMTYGKEMRMLANAFDRMAENLQKRQDELVQTNKLASLGLMSAGIAHEIKNPLAAIKTSIQVIKRRVRTEVSHQLADGIIEEVDRLNKIISDLLNFSKPGPAQIVDYNIKKITLHCLQLMNKDIKDKNVKVIDSTEDHRVEVDPAQMQQILLNLLINALSAVKENSGVIELSTYVSDGTLCMEIKDNGKGIPEDKLDKIFDPFFTMTPTGTGLGLSVVHTLLRQNNIEHKIISRENEGTIFRLIFKERGQSGKNSDS